VVKKTADEWLELWLQRQNWRIIPEAVHRRADPPDPVDIERLKEEAYKGRELMKEMQWNS
jgi:hypothetical protein